MAGLAMQGQTNFIRAIWKFNKVYNADRQFADHQKPVTYQIRPPVVTAPLSKEKAELYVHPKRRSPRAEGTVEGSAA
jgi:magnesium-protoporphyrin IX monomethyl ester (oxidative) cyclase